MAYPTYDIMIGASVAVDTGVQIERATNGSARGRSFFAAPKKRFRVAHVLNASQLTSFRAYIAAMTSDSFTWPGDGLSYTVVLSGDPKEKPLGGGVYTEVELELSEV